VSEREDIVIAPDAERVIKASGEYRSGTHVISVSMEPGYSPPILGHSQISVTLNTYAHVAPEVSREAADRVDQALWGDA
jgi:hypothetical protein